MDFQGQGAKLRQLINLRHQPVAISFLPSAPDGVKRVDRPGPAGCSYWKLAAEGNTFYTEASDHFECTVGAFTHGITLPEHKGKELESLIGTMVQLGYIKAEEIPEMPRRSEAFGVAVYSPLADAPANPDVVIVRCNPRQVMLVAEAARSAGIAHAGEMLGRPACTMIPQAINTAQGNVSLGCIGNRVYTELEEGELYYTLPGLRLGDVVGELEKIVHANEELEKFHAAKQASFSI